MATGTTSYFAMSQPSVSRSIAEVCGIINNVLVNRWITFPTTPNLINFNRRIFMEKYGFPNTIGCIDCTHVAIISPPKDHPLFPAGPYYNRKGFYSINVQLICGGDLKILNVNPRYPGSVHDSAIWQMSAINHHLEREYLERNANYHLIGDEGYPLSPWLITQYPGDIENNSPEGRLNISLRRARTTIERVNGILKSRFRCLLKHRTLNYDPFKAGKIINSCAVLHNLAIHFNTPLPDDDMIEEEPFLVDAQQHRDDNNFFIQGNRKRDRICEEYFA